ncbi:MAG: hypothetical protein O7G83_01095 [Proteobacteria bacterium]|nr:hypothetical protein [Pseudomonadota bacterium]
MSGNQVSGFSRIGLQIEKLFWRLVPKVNVFVPRCIDTMIPRKVFPTARNDPTVLTCGGRIA